MIKYLKISIYFFILTTLVSCERDILIFHNRVLKGKWQWFKTEERGCYHHCTIPYTNITTPASNGKEIIINFKTKGKMTVFENGSKTVDATFNLTDKETTKQNGKIKLFYFTAKASGAKTPFNEFYGQIYGNLDTLKISYHPDGSSSSYKSYYLRIE